MLQFCHITPTPHLDLVEGRPMHLALAHLVEQDETYTAFYKREKERGSRIILDNSAFEMYKQGREMYPSSKLIEMGNKIDADYIVMTDYPGEVGQKTIDKARELAPQFIDAGFGTFFVPQSQIGDLEDCLYGFEWAATHPEYVSYIGVSILTAPNAFGVEKNNKMQRFVSRLRLMYHLRDRHILNEIHNNDILVHFLGMVDGPNEVRFMEPFRDYIDTWDSSAAVWAGLNDIVFDDSPTGLLNGKLELEVDFNHRCTDSTKIGLAKYNMQVIDNMAN